MVFLDFLDFLDFLETSEVAGPGPNPREIDISFGAQWPLACVRGPWARQEHLLRLRAPAKPCPPCGPHVPAHPPRFQGKQGGILQPPPFWCGG